MEFDDYAEYSLKLHKLHKELHTALLHGKKNKALEITVKMQVELSKLQNWVFDASSK